MLSWRITKYNPKYRDEHGKYQHNEWTSISDIGILCSLDEYMRIESSYLQVLTLFMHCTGTTQMQVVDLEKGYLNSKDPLYTDELRRLFDTVTDKAFYDLSDCLLIAQIVLREHLWCKLVANNLETHFGYDYYMYIMSTQECPKVLTACTAAGLFVEPFASPYKQVEQINKKLK